MSNDKRFGYKKLAELIREGQQYAEESISYYCTKEPDGKWYACALGTAFIALLSDDERKSETHINYQRIFADLGYETGLSGDEHLSKIEHLHLDGVKIDEILDILDRSKDFVLAGRKNAYLY